MKADILATNMHLLPEFGNSIKELSSDGFRIDHKIYMSLAGYTNATMIKSLGVFLLSLTDYLYNQTPDIILLAGDRGEQLMTAIAGAHMNIPIAHIQAGETSGNVDGLSRHAMARFVHLHFAANEDARRRLIRSGEESFRIYQVGAPQLDDFVQGKLRRPKRSRRGIHWIYQSQYYWWCSIPSQNRRIWPNNKWRPRCRPSWRWVIRRS